MPVMTNQLVPQATDRVYHISVPADPGQEVAPAIVVFHGGGQDATTIARRWGIEPGSPVPANVADYLLVFPEADARLPDQWVHFKKSDSAFPTLDLEFVDLLLETLAATAYPTGSATVPYVSADPGLCYAAGFSNGAGMVWQLLNSDLVSRFRGFAAVGNALSPEKAERYRGQFPPGTDPPAVPVMYVHGTADHSFRPPATLLEVPIDTTQPAFTVQEMLTRNGIPTDAPAATTTLVPGSGNLTEVVVQSFTGVEAFTYATVINGGHNWPGPSTVGNPPVAAHFDATQAILDFWHTNAGLP
jgi:poly(3-hydroxybutyrate) depolymerase